MSKHATIDASEIPELRRVVEAVRSSGEPLIVRLDSEDIAVLTPVSGASRHVDKKPTQEQIDTVMSAAGSWAGLVDVDELKANWRAARGSRRPPIAL